MWKIYLIGTAAAAAVSSSASATITGAGRNCPLVKCVNLDCPTSQQETPRDANGCLGCPRCTGTLPPTPKVGKGKGSAGLPYGCPMVMCAEPGYCPTALETPTVNGCPSCPRCPCKCGEQCTMFGGGTGVCQTDGACAVNIQAPQCPKPSCDLVRCAANTRCVNGACVPITTGCETVRCNSDTTCVNGRCIPKCICGQSCSLPYGGSGVCQENGQCAVNIQSPQCSKGCETVRCTSTTTCILGQCIPNPPQVCTMEAKICPDGSSVGRQGPNCEFAPCPNTPSGIMCTQEVKVCPDGSYVGREGPSCAFKPCPSGGVVCTQEVKVCPDGSYVGREGPSCAFKPCPTGGVKGCTREVKACPDGSSVGRDSNNNCEFAPCPSTNSCTCGAPCTTSKGAAGLCQANGKCNAKKSPACAASCATILCLTGTTCRDGQCVPY